jgi:excinuclease ABC subunit C
MSDRIERLKARLKEIPERPGVYLHKNSAGEVIYVGKARNLRNRVTSYIVGRGARDTKTMTLVHEIDSIDFVTTNNELEAILLENNLIKAHQPRYNILLRDDKSYPYHQGHDVGGLSARRSSRGAWTGRRAISSTAPSSPAPRDVS